MGPLSLLRVIYTPGPGQTEVPLPSPWLVLWHRGEGQRVRRMLALTAAAQNHSHHAQLHSLATASHTVTLTYNRAEL